MTQDTPQDSSDKESLSTQSETGKTTLASEAAGSASAKTPPPAAKRSRRGGGKQGNDKGGGKGRWGRWGLLLVIIILLVLAGLAWRGWQQLDNRHQQTRQQLQRLEQQQSADEQRTSAASQKLDSKLSTLRGQVLLHGQKIASFGKGGQNRWLLNEAKSLASLAEQRLLLTADLPATLKLLQASDATLSHLDDPRIITARKALAQDMAAVRAAQQVDTTALLLRIGAMRQQLTQLTLPEASDLSRDLTPTTDSQQPLSWWQRMLNRLPITIKRYQGNLPLPLAPAQLAQARLSLAMDLQQAQLALLQARSKVYSQALKQADKTLARYFAANNATAKSLHAELGKLQRVSINQALPKIGAGLEAIKALLRPSDAASANKGS